MPEIELAYTVAFNGVPSGAVIVPEMIPDVTSAKFTFFVSTPAVVLSVTVMGTYLSGCSIETLYDPVGKFVSMRYFPLESVVVDLS